MKRLFAKINQAGLEGLTDPLDYRRVLFINNLSLISIAVSLAVTVLVAVEGLFPQFIITFSGAILFSIVIYFNSKGHYFYARASFLIISVVTLSIASYVAFVQGRFNEVENILIGFMAVNYLLYDGRVRYVGFILIYVVLMCLKVMKQSYAGLPYDLNFYLTLQNVSILCLIVFLFVDAFRKSLFRAFVRLKEKDEILYSMIDNVPLFIGLLDENMRYKMVNINYEKSFGRKRDEIIGSHVKDILPENILNNHLPLIERTLEGETPEFLELTKMPDGSTFYAGGIYTPVKSKEGQIIGAAVFVNDVTKLEEARNKLKDANSTKDKLFSIIAHDIRGPLDLFEGLVNYSSSGDLSREEFLKHQKMIGEKLKDLKDTVSTLLEWARAQLGGVNTTPTEILVRDIVSENLELYKEIIAQKRISTHIDIQPNLKVFMDANHLKIAIRNIIHNSLKFTAPDGDIKIKSLLDGQNMVLTIEDSGMGMDQSKIASILNKELQNSQKGTAGEKGTGLGLSFSIELLEKNNCDVTIDSEVGVGTKTNIIFRSSN